MSKTNFEKIKEMSIEDFLDFANNLNFCSACPIKNFCDNCGNQSLDITCREVLQKWLESECEE